MIDFATLTLVDYGILLVLVLSCVLSTLRGITRELLGLIGWVVSILVANFTAPQIEDPIVDLLQIKGLGAALAWALPFAASVVVWFILASVMAPALTRVGFASLDRWLGVLFGIIRGFGLVLIVFVIAVFGTDGEENLPKIVKDSQSTPLLSRSAHYFSDFVPEDYRDQLINNLSYRPPIFDSKASDSLNAPIEAGKNAINNGMKLFSDEQTK
ncbi:CvpA family protein [Alphaproteobacteria bacterium LSUCC0226]|jgi:membrane protein required for colicin V production|nr:CvpA family protein [Alphaproteobacteria bacterium]